MPDTTLSLVRSHASDQRAGRVTLLERKTALDALAEIAGQARSGEGRLVLLEGEAGVGKSTLLEQFTHDLPDSRLLPGACDGMFTPRPLGPLFDIAQQVHGRLQLAVPGGRVPGGTLRRISYRAVRAGAATGRRHRGRALGR